MTKNEVESVLEAKVAKLTEMDRETEWVEQLISRLNAIPESEFVNCTDFVEIRATIEQYKAPTVKRSTSKQNTYLAFAGTISNATNKAIAIDVGDNGMHGERHKEWIEWIPTSQIVEKDGKIYIAYWLVSKKNLWNLVNQNDKVIK